MYRPCCQRYDFILGFVLRKYTYLVCAVRKWLCVRLSVSVIDFCFVLCYRTEIFLFQATGRVVVDVVKDEKHETKQREKTKRKRTIKSYVLDDFTDRIYIHL